MKENRSVERTRQTSGEPSDPPIYKFLLFHSYNLDLIWSTKGCEKHNLRESPLIGTPK